MNAKKLIFLFLTLSFFSGVNVPVFAAPPPPASATCRITCRVAEVVEWSDASFEDIDLGELNSEKQQTVGQSVLTLYTNGDVIITADNTDRAALSNGSYKLQTEYQLQYNSSGVGQTGSAPTEWCTYDTFLKEAVEIKYNQSDGAVVVVLSVKAEVKDIQPGSGGEYNATQTLTVCWKS